MCVCVSGGVGGGGSMYHEAGREEVMQSEGVFAWKCEQWTDAVFFSHPSSTPHTPTHTHTNRSPTPSSSTLRGMKASSSQGQCQGQSRAN